MNHGDKSPVGAGNETSRKRLTRPDGTTPPNNNDKRQTNNYKYLIAEDLQKLRRSNHSSHQARARGTDDMQESDHDNVIKGLLYPGIEQSENSNADFFEDDYMTAQEAVNQNSTSSSSMAVSEDASNTNRDHRRQRYPPARSEYADLAAQKLGRR